MSSMLPFLGEKYSYSLYNGVQNVLRSKLFLTHVIAPLMLFFKELYLFKWSSKCTVFEALCNT